jgi:hypothetical protein
MEGKKEETLVHCWWECNMQKLLCKMVLPQKVKNRIITWLNNSTSGYIFKRIKSEISKIFVHPCS